MNFKQSSHKPIINGNKEERAYYSCAYQITLASCTIHYKVLLYVFKALHGLAPGYISDIISLHQSNRSLRSNDQLYPMVTRSRFKCKGDRAFSVAAPSLWNDLPQSITFSPTRPVFQSALKTHLFSLAFENVLSFVLCFCYGICL